MDFRDIMVFVDDSAHKWQRVDLAIELAQRSNAYLIGVAVTSPLVVPDFSPGFVSEDLVNRHFQAARERSEQLHQGFNERAERSGLNYEWRAMEPLNAAAVPEAVAWHARHADIAVVGQVGADKSETGLPHGLPALVALVAGRPVLVLPASWQPHPIGKRVVIAWNASREAARALHDAMPLLRSAEEVRVVTLTPKKAVTEKLDARSAADVVAHMARHGISAQADHRSVENAEVGKAILASAADIQADLVVMGAYGNSRWRELILGGASRDVLQDLTLPVLMSH